jgi:hypothetical protein
LVRVQPGEQHRTVRWRHRRRGPFWHSDPVTSPLRDRLRERLTEARRARDSDLVAALRTAVAAIENAEAVPTVPLSTTSTEGPIAGAAIGLGAAEAERRTLDDEDEREIVRAEGADLRGAASQYADLGHAEQAATARRVADALDELLSPRS